MLCRAMQINKMDMDACKQMLVNFYNLLFATTIWIQRPRLVQIWLQPVSFGYRSALREHPDPVGKKSKNKTVPEAKTYLEEQK